MKASFTTTIEPGGKWSAYVSKGNSIRMTASGDRANLACLLFHAHQPSERYNMPDTLKAQHTALLTAGHVLMSDQGRVLASITEDTVGWHDTLSGYTTRESIDAKYGVTRYQSERNDWLRNAEQNLKVELFRHNLTVRDFTTPINFFSKIVCELDGAMRYQGQDTAGKSVTLRTEMDLLVVLSNTPNPMDPGSLYPEAAVELVITDAAPIGEDDLCLNHCGENRRAFENTWNAHALMKGAY
ncbi:urea amidolyase associated protein UAAP1 [Paenibacillus harenae]|uniref:Urea carboxylase-associated protein 2 n=1 Tax=Paenibacillus harenae TaxID=306543 RepID=A0ABT9U708_PAEHA|nr:urea amidolyase associated protein UAAP1 [Paenibacillus harenae]MDQ0060840.1 urea carboxylase-associated protein 2 [Paenibacillus harenae]MDQ0115429.1 urea carboxylase-associated protein 2 [Paenibacillus harenae]